MSIGFIGTGSIAAAMVNGLCTAQPAPDHILVSPRNAERAARLAANHPAVTVAADNQAVLDGSDWVILCVRPVTSRQVLRELRFRPDHKVVTVVATLRSEELPALVAPATRIVRANPLPSCAHHVGPIVMCPTDPDASDLLGRIGTVVAVDDDRQFDRLVTTTALISAFFKFEDTTVRWLRENGVNDAEGRRYVSALFHAIAFDAAGSTASFDEMAAEAATPGGLNEQVVRELTAAGVYEPIPPALDRILARLEGRA